MVDLVGLARRAEVSGDREAYLAVARAAGYRIGAGARAAPGNGPSFFVEVVLDPFPRRPEVDLDSFAEGSALVDRLQSRGYSLSCDDTGVVTCERTIGRERVSRELQEVQAMLTSLRRPKRTRRRP